MARPRLDPWKRIAEVGTCWFWLGAITGGGYGALLRPPHVRAHRWFYEQIRGPIPEGHDLDHLCRNRGCVNPWHCEPVTPQENQWRSPLTLTGIAIRKTHCIHGHEFTPENTTRDAKGARRCRACRRVSGLRWYYANKARTQHPANSE